MRTNYFDIISRIGAAPLWFDEHAVPRFEPFEPRLLANIYAEEAVLLEIACQGCDQIFHVAITISVHDRYLASEDGHQAHELAEMIRASAIEFGDPPNVDCCPAGPTMNSVPHRVIEYWKRKTPFEWVRDSTLEIPVPARWAASERPSGADDVDAQLYVDRLLVGVSLEEQRDDGTRKRIDPMSPIAAQIFEGITGEKIDE